ncbi:MAG: cytochrome c biogenesis CcdA family protein [Candidatus Limnocylindria bacterium]
MIVSELTTGFVIGLFATLSPCALPLYPGFLAYLAARRDDSTPSRAARWLGLVVLAGVLTTMLVLGALMAALAVSTSSVLRIVTPLADLVVIALGVVLLLGRDPFAKLPMLGPATLGGGMVRSAYIYGLLYGPIALPCAAPLLVAMFGLSLSFDSFSEALAFFMAFGLGFGLPLLVISLLAYSTQLSLVRLFVRHRQVVSRIAGAVLIAVGAIDLANNLPLILLTL